VGISKRFRKSQSQPDTKGFHFSYPWNPLHASESPDW
jgi:hypothetical protein